MTTRLILFAFAALVAACAAPSADPLQSRERVASKRGFSFLPPQGTDWREEFGTHEITYVKETDPQTVTFYGSAIEGPLGTALPDRDALIAFVRSRKDDWGSDGRYANTSSSFDAEPGQESCVRYQLSASDLKAPNKGAHEFLLVRTIGRFCLHPQDRTSGVDLFYSVKHVPPFDPKGLIAEGERFLESLQFSSSIK